ncbi:putative histone acetyltransferase HAC-like 1 isoform X1 [Carex littledalei]|uniref:histone acetyltransferase n=1 Tax=Carex littledalei TaxID=544730 RepID=A0A833QIJ8_9POAL|nr:putative histone acetyltransferase HAC-like 1 isoform X1 [Carex littledalei]
MMIHTPPGISHNPTGTMRMPSLMESNQGINPTSVPAGIPMSNGYQLSHGNMSIDQPGSTSMSASIGVRHQVTPQMIRTPGFNSTSITQVTQQTMPMNNGSGMQPQKQQQYNTLSGQVRPGMQSVPMNQKHSSQGFEDGMMNNNSRLGLLGNNMQQLMNGQGMSKGYMDIGGTYGNLTKPLQQGFSSQQIQQRMPTSLSQQEVSLMGNNTVTKQVDVTMSSSGNCYNPAGPSNMSSASNVNKISTVGASLQLKPRPMMTRGGNQLHQQSMQQQQQQPMMMRAGNQLHQRIMQHKHQQQQQQQQPMMMRGGNQLHQQSIQQQQPMMMRGGNQLQQSMQQQHAQQQQQPMMTRGGNNTFSRQSSLRSIGSLGGINTDQVMAESALLTNNHLMLPQLVDFQVPFGNNKGGQGQFFGPLAGSNALNQTVQSDESSSQNGVVNGRSRGGVHQPDSMLVQQESQWRPTQQMQRNNYQMVPDSNNNSHNSNALIEKNQISQNKLDQPCMTILSEGERAPGPSVTTMLVPNKGSSQSKPSHRETQYLYHIKLILFLFHARSCPAQAGHCREKNCVKAQEIYKHVERCCKKQCQVHHCLEAQTALLHFHNCQEENCPVCIPAHKFINMAKHKSLTLKSGCGSKKGLNEKEVDNNKVETASPVALPASAPAPAPLALKHSQKGMNQLDSSSGVLSDQMDVEPLPKRPRMDMDISSVSINNAKPSFSALQEAFPIEQQSTSNIPAKQETDVTIDPALQNSQIVSTVPDTSSIQMGYGLDGCISMIRSSQTDVGPAGPSLLVDNKERNYENATEAKQEEMEEDVAAGSSLLVENKERNDENETEAKQEELEEDGVASKSEKCLINGVSMTELFTPEQVREHIKSLRQWVGQSKSKAEKNQAILMNENSCQLCAVVKLTFGPPPIYCTPCGYRIKRNAMYYTIVINGQRHYICISCFNGARGETIKIEGHDVPKRSVEKKRNDEETEEAWVQCDKCEAWQHQICALFNGRRNDGGQAEYTCPNCYIQEVETGERKPLPQSAVLGAKDLPRTILSDHIENRLFKRLKQERQDRANHFGMSFDEVPGAEELVVRVVSSVDKKLDVKPRFLEVFQKENYPTEFPYKSKAILLFQKIEGVEVCIFGMYVQEFGTECAFPNQRRVYLSYLDSIKYFRPEIRTVSGEALRTFVYHEILIGYLEYVKRRGFTSCYIWACPPLKGEDYILYCHPEIQKTPKTDKLREWYLSMLKKAVKENIVVDLTNMYDHFFTDQRESRAKVTAARLPYFDGDYWPGAAEDIITQLRQEEDDRKQNKKGNMKKTTITKRALKPAGYTDLSVNASKDAMVMHKLGETIFKMREDLIMVHLQHPCNHCCILMVSGTCWVCNSCRYFNLCESCYNTEKLREDKERHPTHSREKHTFRPMEISGVPNDTKDKDDILESEFFDTRQAFLSLCQVNHYQYDTLRSAKHSSMMVLYHLHNPTAPAYLTTCTVCSHEIEAGQGKRCEVCPDFDVCNSCYQKEEVVNHPHKLTNRPSNAERDAQNKEARQKRVSQLGKMLELLGHASECRSPGCLYPNCRKIKGLFRHGVNCTVRIYKGCCLCKKIWYLLQLHARACKETVCNVPRCKDLKEQMRRIQQQTESRRRAAVNEMLRQRAAEISQNQ